MIMRTKDGTIEVVLVQMRSKREVEVRKDGNLKEVAIGE